MATKRDEPKKARKLACPLCKGTEFTIERGRVDSRWGWTSHKVTIRICTGCGYMLSFSEGRSLFDFD